MFQQAHAVLAIEALLALLLPQKGRYGLHDYEKMFSADIKGGHDIFAMRGIDRKAGCVVVVRPDQYVAQVLPIDGYKELASYFDRFMLPQAGAALSAGHGSAAPAGLRARARWLHSGSASTTA